MFCHSTYGGGTEEAILAMGRAAIKGLDNYKNPIDFIEMNKKLRFGIIGYGKMGKIRAQSIVSSKEAKLISVFDVSNYKLDHANIKICKSFNVIDTNIDAVFVSTYVKFSAKYKINSLKAGKHVFCENHHL